ncbi:MAG: MFS transporter [Zetaproteobacteria bacterium]|nr:MFS transporter [Zetaproteobacteria bacterium]
MTYSTDMNAAEKRGAGSLAAIFGLRMLGLFLILPVFSTYAHGLEGALEHPELVGIALGAYGLTQALLQIPFGMMSDRFGRKPVIAVGMILFAIGSVIAAMSTSIEGVLLGRVIQGSGAVAAAITALVADLTRDEHRTKAMSMIGITIGVSFAISMVLGPILNAWIGVDGIFWLTGVLALLSILVLYFVVPEVKKSGHHSDSEVSSGSFGRILRDVNLLRLDAGVMILHASLTALFVVLPMVLADKHLHLLALSEQWKLYLPVMLVSFVLMIPLVIIAEAKRKMKQVFMLSIALLVMACVMLATGHGSLMWIAIALVLFFTGFNTLEASLPSLVAKYAPAGVKGTAMGVFNTSQFFGAFLGGVLGGFMYHPALQNYAEVFWVVAILFVLWLLIAATMEQPPYLAARSFKISITSQAQAKGLECKLLALEGVDEAVVILAESSVYCKVDNKLVDEEKLYMMTASAG